MDILFENGGLVTIVTRRATINLARLWNFAIFGGMEADVAQLGSIDRARAGDFNFRTPLEENQVGGLEVNLAITLTHDKVE